MPTAEVPIQMVSILQSAEVQVAPTITIHVARGYARAVHADLVGGRGGIAQPIAAGYSGNVPGQTGETRSAACRHCERTGTVTWARFDSLTEGLDKGETGHDGNNQTRQPGPRKNTRNAKSKPRETVLHLDKQ